jgi:WD40 repeat protein
LLENSYFSPAQPLPLSILAASVNLSETQLRERLAELGSLFPIRKGSSSPLTEDTVTSYHKSIIDWLSVKDELTGYFKAGSYVVDIEAGKKNLTDACWAQYQQCPHEMSVYALHHLPYHLSSTGRGKDLETILIDFSFMDAKLHALGVYSLIDDYDLVYILSVGEKVNLNEKSLKLIQGALQLSAHILTNKKQLRSQLTGRLLSSKEPEIRSLLETIREWKDEMWLRPMTTSLTPPGGSLILSMKGHTGGVTAISVTPDGRHAISGSSDGTFKVWDMESGVEIRSIKVDTEKVTAISVTPDGRHAISGSWDGTIKVWDMESGVEIRTIKVDTEGVTAISVTPDGRHAISASHDNTLKIWDMESGSEIRTLKGHTDTVWTVAVTPDGRRAISGSSDNTIKVWDMESGVEIRTLQEYKGKVLAVFVTPDGRHAISTLFESMLNVWDMESGVEIRTMKGYTVRVNAVSVTPDGKRAISAIDDNTLKIWDMESGFEIRTIRGHTGSVSAVSVTPDGRRAISASGDKMLKVWDIERGVEIRTMRGHTGGVFAVSVTPDGRGAISASSDKTLKVWDMESGSIIASFCGESVLYSCGITPDGKTIVAGDKSGRMHFMRLENVVYGSSIATAWHLPDRLPAFGCPICRTWSEIPSSALGNEIPCPNCGKLIKLNLFTINADWRQMAKAWGMKDIPDDKVEENKISPGGSSESDIRR